jgi:hypothetical protein
MLRGLLNQIEAEVNKLAEAPYPSDDEAVDAIGQLARISKKVNDYKRGLMAELPGPTTGIEYRAVQKRKGTRSYNTGALLSAFAEQGVTIHDLRAEDAVRLTWRWTELKRAAYVSGVTLRIAPREIEDTGEVDGPMIGETWSEEISVVTSHG